MGSMGTIGFRSLIALLPIILAFLMRFLLMSDEAAQEVAKSLVTYNFSFDIMLTSFGALMALSFLKGSQSGQQSVAVNWGLAALMLVFISVLVLCVVFPKIGLYDADHLIWAFLLPNSLSVLHLAFVVRAMQ